MLAVLLFLLLAAGAFAAWRFRARLTLSAAGVAKALPDAVPDALPATAFFAREGTFLPEDFESDALEAEDLRWLLERQRATLEREEKAHLQRESAARQEELGEQLDRLSARLDQLQLRMDAWKMALLERESLQLAYNQLQSEHLDQQYGFEALRSENERLRLELAEARKEALLDYEENERLKKQLVLLRNLTREEEGF